MNAANLSWSVLALSLSVALGSCHAGTVLDNEKAASLILAEELHECAVGQSPFMSTLIFQGSPHDSTTQAARALAWLADLQNHPGTRLISRGRGQFMYGTQEYFSHIDDGHELLIDAFIEDDDMRTQAIIRTCATYPSEVDMLDIAPDATGKRAHVTYRLKGRVSDVQRQMIARGLGTFPFPRIGEFNATLRYLDATGWRFEGHD